MSSIHKLCVRPFPHHPVYAPVHLFRRKHSVSAELIAIDPKATPSYLTVPLLKGTSDPVMQNVLIASTNPVASMYIMQCNQDKDIVVEQHCISVAKHLAAIMQLHLVTCITLTCDSRDCSEVWDASYYVPPAISVQDIRLQLHHETTT